MKLKIENGNLVLTPDTTKDKEELLNMIKQIERERETITLLYSAKEEKYNNTVALDDILRGS
jgi:uncharacterized protein YeaO (DUF488 family)